MAMRVCDARGTACTDVTIQDTPQKKLFSSAIITSIYPTCHTHIQRHTQTHTHTTLSARRWSHFHQPDPASGECRGAPCDAGAVTKIQYGGICQEMIFFFPSSCVEEKRRKKPRSANMGEIFFFFFFLRKASRFGTHAGTTGLLPARV